MVTGRIEPCIRNNAGLGRQNIELTTLKKRTSLLFSGSIPKDVLRANMTALVLFLKNGCNQLMVKMKLKVV